ncbi:dienelactone hydrolase family protein [Proteiniclasticum sp. SCR006]|uniref:Dienelactone hydrolase family protein n=1 Tax=Proteiniclasticum aestuarii TaxID=2817862 RepID=A0A939H997_9CLOT|nr:dienelactone hydrolase family protein [Proteiniclasticum aestuarii]MBO1265491.1 dienelactone hydrolase family protein [Proteiniclasticum aestuarii]
MNTLTMLLEKSKVIGPLLMLILAMQLLFMKPRWQLYPFYLVLALYFILSALYHLRGLEIGARGGRWILGAALALLVLSALSLLAFPKDTLPLPTGPFAIGTRVYDLEDPSRAEHYTEAEGDSRRIKYQIWYPAEETKGYEKARWITEGTVLTRQLARSFRFPFFMLDHTADIKSNSYLSAPLRDEREPYPVVIISHGWQGFRELHTDFAEELASNGFIAVSIDHTYGSQAVRLPDETVAYLNPDALPGSYGEEGFAESSQLLVTTYGEDVISVLNDLEKKNREDDFLKDRMDLSSIGVMGHSTGGGGDVHAALKDARIRALLGLDAWVNPLDKEVLSQGLDIPALFIRSEQWSQGPNNTALGMLLSASEEGTFLQMNKTNHVDFSMAYMYSPLAKYVGFSGELGGREGISLQKKLLLEFFDASLRNQSGLESLDLEEIMETHEGLVPVGIQ